MGSQDFVKCCDLFRRQEHGPAGGLIPFHFAPINLSHVRHPPPVGIIQFAFADGNSEASSNIVAESTEFVYSFPVAPHIEL